MIKRLLPLLFVIPAACSIENSEYVKYTDYVPVTEASMPDTVDVNTVAAITAMAEAYNGCWRDIVFRLSKRADFIYSLDALATFESTGVCTQQMVYGDTVINFVPEATGKYIFLINDYPYQSWTDTLLVR